MPATMQLGRIISGQGFVPVGGWNSYNDIPPASCSHDVPHHLRLRFEALAQSNRADAVAYQPPTHHQTQAGSRNPADSGAVYQQAKLPTQSQTFPAHSKTLPSYSQALPNPHSQTPGQNWQQQQPSLSSFLSQPTLRTSALAEGKRPMTADSAQAQAKRPRLSIPDLSAYGRSTSDPPMSLQRRMANAADMPISVLDGRLVFPPQPQSRHLKSHNSGPARVDARPSPNYRIYSNAFQGGRGPTPPAPYSGISDKVLGLKLNPRFASGQNRSQGQPDPTPHPALLKQPPPSGSISKKDAMVLNGSSPLHSSGTASLHTDSQPVKHASQHTDSTSAQRAFQHTDDTTAQAAAEELSQTTGQASQSVEQEARESSEQEAAQDSPVASAELRGHSPEREGSRAVHNRFSPDAPAVELSSSLASDSVSSQPSTSAKHSMHSMSHESAVSQPSESADMPRQQLEEEDEGEPTDSHGDMSSGEAGKEAVSKQALEDGNCPADTRAVGPALPFQHRADAQNGVEAPLQECKTASESRLELPQGQNSSSTAPDVKIVIKDSVAAPAGPNREGSVSITQAPGRPLWNGPVSNGPTPAPEGPAPASTSTALKPFHSQNPLTASRPFTTHTHPPSFPSPAHSQGQAFPNQAPLSGQSFSSHHLSSSHPLKHQLSQAGFSSQLTQTQTHFSQQPSQHVGQGGSHLPPPGAYSHAQLQAMLAGCMRRDEHKEEAVLGAAAQDSASISQWLQQAHDTAGKSQRPRAIGHDPRLVPNQSQSSVYQRPGIPSHLQGIPSHLQGIASGHSQGIPSHMPGVPSGHSQTIPSHAQGIPGLQARPIQAQLQVLRDSFHRVARPPGSDPSLPPTYPSSGVPSFPASAFPSLLHTTPSGYPLGSAAPNAFSRAAPIANPRPDNSSSIPRVGSAGNLQHQGLQQTHNVGRSSLPPSVAKYLAELEQHQTERQSSSVAGTRQQLPQQASAGASQASYGSIPSMLDQARHSQLPGPTSGFASTARPLDSVRITGQYENMGSGYSLPSRVVTEGAAAGVRNPALLNRPVATSHRDPQEHPHGPHLGLHDVSPAQQESSSRYPAVGDRGSAPYTSGFTEHNAQVTGSSPKGNIGKQGWSQSTHQLQSIPPAVQALAALLSNSKLSSSDVTHLQSLANSQHTGNLGQLAAQLEMAIQLASSSQAQGHSSELRAQTQSFPEATHRVQIPAAQLMDRSAARVGSGAHVPSGPPVVAPAAFAAPTDTAKAASRQQPPKADKAAAHRLRQEPVSALDLVAEVAAAVEENNEPSELLMLAAETLAGLNSVPRSSAEGPRSGTASLEHSSNEGHAGRKSGKPKALPEGPKSAPRRAKHSTAQHRAVAHPGSSTQPAAMGSGQGSFHPVLGLHVPHARRSYHRDTVAKADVAALHAGHAEQQAYGMSAIHQGLVKPRKTTHSRAQKNAGYAARPQPPLRRVPSDSSMTVSANSNDD